MKHNIFILFFIFFISHLANASCENDHLSIKVLITANSLEVAYNNGSVFLSDADRIEVYEKKYNKLTVFKDGALRDDQAGSFYLVAPSILNPKLTFTHDHESSYLEGLFGVFVSELKTYDLSGLKCQWSELFEEI